MKNLMTSVKDFLVSEDGPTAVEYAVMLALIIAVLIAVIQVIGTKANSAFSKTSTALDGAT